MTAVNAPEYSRFEAFGRCLPSLERTTEEVVSGTPVSARALLMLTGIRRRLACDVDAGECAEQLALSAARDCLSKSRYDAADLDVVISSAIFRSDERRRLSFEPSVASVIAREIGSTAATCFDVSNACAGMFTGILLLDRMIKAGTIRRGMVVSGEHASLITGSARQEIAGLRDLQLASLTVGDAGMAVIVDGSTDAADRIHAFEMTTSAAYASLCKAMPSDETAGLVMHTDSARQQASERMQIGVSLTEDVHARAGRTPPTRASPIPSTTRTPCSSSNGSTPWPRGSSTRRRPRRRPSCRTSGTPARPPNCSRSTSTSGGGRSRRATRSPSRPAGPAS